MHLYIIIYSILIISCFFETQNKKTLYKKYIIFINILIFTLFRGLRWEIGTDWDQYYDVYLDAEWNNIFRLLRATGSPMEFGYVFINVLVKTIFNSYTLFLIITNLFILVSYYHFSIKYSKYPIITFATILFSTNFFPVRQDLAIAILLYAYQYLINKNTKRFFLLIFIATCIHNVSFVFGILFFIRKIKINIIKIYIILILSILLSTLSGNFISFIINKFTFIPPVILVKLQAYSNMEATEGLSQKGITSILLVFIFVTLSIIYVNHLRKKNNNIEKLKSSNIFLISTTIFYASQFFFVGSFIYFARIGTCFSIVNNILLINSLIFICNNINKNSNHPKLIPPIIIIILFFLFRFSRMITLYPELHFPYKTIL